MPVIVNELEVVTAPGPATAQDGADADPAAPAATPALLDPVELAEVLRHEAERAARRSDD